jgi:hypothetical protein
MSWTQGICDDCWEMNNPGREPYRLLKPERETCCVCGGVTLSGIYVRRRPVVRVKIESYEVEAPEQIMVFGTDEDGVKVCFRVTGPDVQTMREHIDAGEQVEAELPRSRSN